MQDVSCLTVQRAACHTRRSSRYAAFLAKAGGVHVPQVAELLGAFVRMRTHHPARAMEMLQGKLRALDDEQVVGPWSTPEYPENPEYPDRTR